MIIKPSISRFADKVELSVETSPDVSLAVILKARTNQEYIFLPNKGEGIINPLYPSSGNGFINRTNDNLHSINFDSKIDLVGVKIVARRGNRIIEKDYVVEGSEINPS